MLQNIDMQILSTVIQKPDEMYKAVLLKNKTICEHNIKSLRDASAGSHNLSG